MPEKNTCFTCKWWNVKGMPTGKGNCFLRPPQIVAIPVVASAVSQQVEVRPIGIRPTTGALDYCHGYRSDLVKK